MTGVFNCIDALEFIRRSTFRTEYLLRPRRRPVHFHMQFDSRLLICALFVTLLAACSDQEASREPSEVGQVDIT